MPSRWRSRSFKNWRNIATKWAIRICADATSTARPRRVAGRIAILRRHAAAARFALGAPGRLRARPAGRARTLAASRGGASPPATAAPRSAKDGEAGRPQHAFARSLSRRRHLAGRNPDPDSQGRGNVRTACGQHSRDTSSAGRRSGADRRDPASHPARRTRINSPCSNSLSMPARPHVTGRARRERRRGARRAEDAAARRDVAVEGDLDERNARRLVAEAGGEVVRVYRRRGKQGLRRQIGGYRLASRYAPWLVLVDLDEEGCPPRLREDWGAGEDQRGLCFRVAVRAAESWLLATATASRGCSASPATASPIGRTRSPSPIPSARSSTRLAGPGAAACATPSSPGPARGRGRSTRQRSAGSSRSSGVRQPPPNDRRASRVAAAGSPSSSNAPATAAGRRRRPAPAAPPAIGRRGGSAAAASAPGALPSRSRVPAEQGSFRYSARGPCGAGRALLPCGRAARAAPDGRRRAWRTTPRRS